MRELILPDQLLDICIILDIIHLFGDLVLYPARGIFHFAQALAEATCYFGNLLGAKEHQHHEEDEKKFGAAYVKHTPHSPPVPNGTFGRARSPQKESAQEPY